MVDSAGSAFSASTYAIALVIIVGGLGFLLWRRRQRLLELEATAVSSTPVAAAVQPAGGANRFTPEILSQFEWRRFEELVVSYYNKTGVVAQRTKMGPTAPVNIRISWKGEQRPFACVHCVARPTALIEADAVRALADTIAAEDIRRGYVVTSGKFSVAARDAAEEKQITLLAGDIFCEKLNALPDSVRAELMREAMAGDHGTATCPRCDIKMMKASDGSGWRCVQCGTVLNG